MHVWVVGATGTGKTQRVLMPMIRADILAGHGVLFIDGKGDLNAASAIHDFAVQSGRAADFVYFDPRRPGGSWTYSPLCASSPNEQVDRIMNALDWESAYYRAQSNAALLRVMRALGSVGLPYTLDDVLVALSDRAALDALTRLTRGAAKQADLRFIASRWKEFHEETNGLRSQLESLLLTDFEDLLSSPQPELVLADAYRKGAIVVMALPVLRYEVTARFLAKLVIGDLSGVSSQVEDGKLPKRFFSVVIDEFAAFAMPQFANLLNKARSAGISIAISHQAMRADLIEEVGEGFVGQISNNTNVHICMRQSDDAEYVANLAGTRRTSKRTEQVQDTVFGHDRTGLGSAREVDEYQVSPNVVRELKRGQAVIRVNQPKRLLDLVELDFVNTDVLKPYDPPQRLRLMGSGLNLRARAGRNPPPPGSNGGPDPGAFEGA